MFQFANLEARPSLLSYDLDLPSGPTIVMLAGFYYLAVVVGKGLKNRLR